MEEHEKDIIANVRQLVETIHTLQQQKQKAWLSWGEIAKHQEGSETVATMLSGYATLSETAHYFQLTPNGNKVSLTEAGQKWLLQAANEMPLTLPQEVSKAVKAYARQLRRLQFEITGIAGLAKAQRRIVHAVSIELGDALVPNEAPVTLVARESGIRTYGRIVGQNAEEGLFFVALETSFLNDNLPAYMTVDRAFLLYQLAESLGKLETLPLRGRALLEPDETAVFNIADRDSGKVADALSHLKPPWTRFLWGPPGAGKTYGLARLVSHLLNNHPEERILLVAPSNVAVDVALIQVIQQLTQHGQTDLVKNRRVLRFGYPRHPDILATPELLGSKKERQLGQQIKHFGEELKEAEKRQSPESEQAVLRAQLLDAQEQLNQLVADHMAQCQFVATTTTLAYASGSPVHKQAWSTILIDEVTMVPPAICLYLSSLVEQRFLLAGDPRQLGPVFEQNGRTEANAVKWMGRDVYDFSGLSIGENTRRHIQTGDARLVRITSQRRSCDDVWQPIRPLYTGVSNDVDDGKIKHWRQLEPNPGQGIALLDTRKVVPTAQCYPLKKSWYNPATALYAVQLAQELIVQASTWQYDPPTVSIVTPYRGQYQEMKRLLKEAGLQQAVMVGTIHQFQGSEADVIIFDMVDGDGRTGLGKLLRGDTGLRLINVAISRARGKFILLADKTWCRHYMNREDNYILWDVLMRSGKTKTPSSPSQDTSTKKQRSVSMATAQTSKAPSSLVVPPTSALTGEMPNEPIAAPDDVDSKWLERINVGVIYTIPNKRVKRSLNQLLSQLKLVSHYDAEQHVTTWLGSDKQFRILHHKACLIRDK